MHTQEQSRFRQHGSLLPSSRKRLDRFRSMPILRRCRAVLVVRCEANKGGAVVPPCDFQKCYNRIALFLGVYTYARPRNARPRPRPPTMTAMACS